MNDETKISPTLAATLMQQIKDKSDGDPEEFHRKADDLLCAILVNLGYEDAVNIFELAKKWYA